MNKKITFLLLFLSFYLILFSQENDYVFHHKIENNQLYVRWIPQNVSAFQHGINGKITMELYSITGTIVSPEYDLLLSQNVKPKAYDTWRSLLKLSVWDTVAIATIYADRLDTEIAEKVYHSIDIFDVTSSKAWQYRLGASDYCLGYEWSAIEDSGLGFTRSIDKDVETYGIKIYPTATGDTLFYDINIKSYKAPKIPELAAVYKDKKAELQWRTLEYRNDFFAWYLDRSEDGGKTWNGVFDLPLMNDYDTINGVGDALKYLYKTDLLPENGVEVQYRLQGADFLGRRSINQSIATGEGHDDITLSPLMLKTIQTDSNYAVIHWEYDEDYNALLQEFRIVVTDTTGQNYRIALEGINPTKRKAAVFMKFRSNFFRVQAVSKQGTVLTSFESLVMMYDVDPPAVPRNFDGYIDSLGAVHLNWITSDEIDLAGYYLFKGYFKEEEKAMITPDPLPGPTHIDSVDMETGNELVYYQLRSVDTRGNGSAFTHILELKKPDVFPPASPRIVAFDNDGHQVNLRWVSSPSPDVESYRLYRQIIEEEEGWSVLLSFDNLHFQDSYIDTNVELGKTYAYTMQVTDDDGLLSGFSQAVSLRLKDFGIRGSITPFTGQANAGERFIDLNWIYSKSPREFYIYRGQGDMPLSLLKVIDGDNRSYRDEKLRRNEQYRYVIRAVFSNGNMSPYSEELEVIIE